MFVRLLLVACFVWVASVMGGIIDDFNRPDAPTLGPNWTVRYGGAEIVSGQARALNASQTFNLVTYNGLTATSAYVDVFPGSDVTYIAIVLAYLDNFNNFFIKVQHQDTPNAEFTHYAFYYGNNGGGHFWGLSSPFTSGRITAGYTGLDAFLHIDTNFDGIPEQQYTYTYGSATGGTGVGLGFYGSARADNFGTGPYEVIPEPASLALVLGGLGTLIAARLRKRAA